MQRHPLSGRAIHVDFFLPDLTAELQIDVPLVFVGEAPAIEATGGSLFTSLRPLKVSALPADLPHEITVDVTSLVDLEAAIHVRDLGVESDTVHVLNDPDEMVARVMPPRVDRGARGRGGRRGREAKARRARPRGGEAGEGREVGESPAAEDEG